VSESDFGDEVVGNLVAFADRKFERSPARDVPRNSLLEFGAAGRNRINRNVTSPARIMEHNFPVEPHCGDGVANTILKATNVGVNDSTDLFHNGSDVCVEGFEVLLDGRRFLGHASSIAPGSGAVNHFGTRPRRLTMNPMKRHGILNGELARVVASIGHGQTILIADAGMPRPPGVLLIDLAVTLGLPGFVDVVRSVVSEMAVEKFTVAGDLVVSNQAVLRDVRGLLPNAEEMQVSHDRLKELSASAVAFVRTGEGTPYANVLLFSGVVF
jgi:D-ribose pyranase